LKVAAEKNATKRWWKFVPCTWASRRIGPVSERRCSSWHCNCTGCGRSETTSDSCSSRRRDQVRRVRWCVAVQAAMYHHTQLVLDALCQWRSRSREVSAIFRRRRRFCVGAASVNRRLPYSQTEADPIPQCAHLSRAASATQYRLTTMSGSFSIVFDVPVPVPAGRPPARPFTDGLD